MNCTIDSLQSWSKLEYHSENSDYVFSVDYLTVNVKCPSLMKFLGFFQQFTHSLPECRWLPINPKRLYRHALGVNGQHIIRLEYSFKVGSDGLEIPDEIELESSVGVNSGILVEISGDGLRFLGADFFYNFIFELNNRWDCHFTRIDLAMDIFKSDNKVIPLILDSFDNTVAYKEDNAPCVISRLSNPDPKPRRDPFKRTLSRSAYLGKRSGAKYIRCYDKCLEQRQRFYNQDEENFKKIPDYWYRLEFQIRNSTKVKYVNSVIKEILYNKVSLQSIFVDFLTSSFYIANVKKRYNTYTLHEPNEVWDSFISDLTLNNYFVEFTYLEYVLPNMNPEKVSDKNRRPNTCAFFSQTPDEISDKLFSTCIGICYGSTAPDIRYRNYLLALLGVPDSNYLTPEFVYNHIIQKFRNLPFRCDDLNEVDLEECEDIPF